MPARTFLIDRNTQEKYCIDGLLPSDEQWENENLRKYFSDHIVLDKSQLPPKVDLRSSMTPVESQAKTSSCVANAVAGALEYLLKKITGDTIDVSRLFIYYNARMKNPKWKGQIIDKGCTQPHAIEALAEFGTCLESMWPYDISRINERPSSEAFATAQNYCISDALQLNCDLDQMKLCLAQGYPFVFGIKLFKSFSQAAKQGVVPCPNPTEEQRNTHGRHCMLAVGYSDRSNAFIVRNSWGTKWGDNGYCYIAYDYIGNPKYFTDAWVIRKLDTDDMGRDHWQDDDSIDYQTNDFDNNGNNYFDFDFVEVDDDEYVEE